MSRSALLISAALVLTSLWRPLAAGAQDPDGFTWENATEFSFVATSGNQSSNTFGLKSTLEGASEAGAFKLELAGIRASSTFRTRTAVGTPEDFVLNVEERTEESAASYLARARYDHTLDGMFVFGGAGWERNTFSGFNHRVSTVAGVGKAWVDDDTSLFKTDAGLTYTLQKDVEPNPAVEEGFVGLRATVEGKRALNDETEVASVLILDENLNMTEDLRLDWTASIAVDLLQGLALQTSFKVLFDNDPALVSAPLMTGDVENGTVLVPTDKVDTFLTLSLVITL